MTSNAEHDEERMKAALDTHSDYRPGFAERALMGAMRDYAEHYARREPSARDLLAAMRQRRATLESIQGNWALLWDGVAVAHETDDKLLAALGLGGSDGDE